MNFCAEAAVRHTGKEPDIMRVLVVLVLAAVSCAAAPKSLPSLWPKCKRSNPKLNECIRDAVQVAIADLSEKGAKEFGVFPIDPLVISRVDIDQGKGPVSIELHFSDLHIYGLKNTIVGALKADLDKIRFQAPVYIKQGVTLKGQYKIDGKVLVLPIKGQGECELNLDNVTATVELVGTEFKKDGVKYAQVPTFKFGFDTTKLKIRLENLFNGNKQLSDQMNKFLNENWSEILNELKPAIQDAFGVAFADISNRIFRRVPYNKIFE